MLVPAGVHPVGAPPESTFRCEPGPSTGRSKVKSREEIMEILEAFDLTRSYRDAAELVGCSHHTVADWVAKRDAGLLRVEGEPQRRDRMIDPFLPKIEEWVQRSS